MDGQRRLSRQVKVRAHALSRDVPVALRAAVRAGGVLLIGFAIMHGLLQGGHLTYNGSPWLKLPGKLAGLIGLAADDISIAGIEHHDPAQVLAVIGVRPGGSLVGFDAVGARRKLEALPWVQSATVQREFPNQLQLSLVEAQPFAVWQHNGTYAVIDREGNLMGPMDEESLKRLPLITGEGANTAAAEIINQLEATPDLKMKVFAVARVGQRRWTLYLDNGVKVALPEQGVPDALQRVARLDRQGNILSRGIRELDLRVPGETLVALAAPPAGDKKTQ